MSILISSRPWRYINYVFTFLRTYLLKVIQGQEKKQRKIETVKC